MLAFLHISAVLGLVVFASSEAALCRAEWMNAAVVERLVRVNAIGWIASAVLLLSGLARMVWGDKGWAWLAGNPLLHLKLALFAVVLLLAIRPTRSYRRWRRALQAGGGGDSGRAPLGDDPDASDRADSAGRRVPGARMGALKAVRLPAR